jgi:hypothetical protein
MNYVGIDHHRQYSHMTLMDQEGQMLRSARVPNLRFAIERFLEGGEAMEAVIETERSSYAMVDILEEMEVLVSPHHRRNLVFGSVDCGLIFRLSDPIQPSSGSIDQDSMGCRGRH